MKVKISTREFIRMLDEAKETVSVAWPSEVLIGALDRIDGRLCQLEPAMKTKPRGS